MPSPRSVLPLPDDAELLRDALDGLETGLRTCTCPHRYHALWGVFKAVGVHRGIHAEAEGLAAVLRPLLAPHARVLVAGAADTTSLQLLAACAGQPSSLDFAVADRCPAPLGLATRYADARGLRVRPLQADLAAIRPGDAPWDLVFLHYTLSFADAATRRSILAALAAGLAGDGRIVCVAKFGERSADAADAQAWLAPLRPRIERLLAGHPEARAAVDALLPGYAQARGARAAAQPALAELEHEFADAGLAVVARHDTTRGDWTRSAAFPTVDRQRSAILVAAHAPGAH